MELLKEIAKDKLVIMVTHNPELAQQYSTRIVKLLDGNIIDDSNPFSDEDEAKEDDGSYAPRKTSMSMFTAFSLSLNNLMTKKGRTFLTAFAGSIGIIGIALILSLSSGFQKYINDVQEETLATYPVQITKKAMDYNELLSKMVGNNEENSDHNHAGEDKIYSGDIMGDMLVSMVSDVKENDLESFKNYIEDDANGFTKYTSDITYTYDTPLYVFNENSANGGVAQVNPSTTMTDMDLEVWRRPRSQRQISCRHSATVHRQWTCGHRCLTTTLCSSSSTMCWQDTGLRTRTRLYLSSTRTMR